MNDTGHRWYTPEEKTGPIPVGYPRCANCGAHIDQAETLPCPNPQPQIEDSDVERQHAWSNTMTDCPICKRHKKDWPADNDAMQTWHEQGHSFYKSLDLNLARKLALRSVCGGGHPGGIFCSPPCETVVQHHLAKMEKQNEL